MFLSILTCHGIVCAPERLTDTLQQLDRYGTDELISLIRHVDEDPADVGMDTSEHKEHGGIADILHPDALPCRRTAVTLRMLCHSTSLPNVNHVPMLGEPQSYEFDEHEEHMVFADEHDDSCENVFRLFHGSLAHSYHAENFGRPYARDSPTDPDDWCTFGSSFSMSAESGTTNIDDNVEDPTSSSLVLETSVGPQPCNAANNVGCFLIETSADQNATDDPNGSGACEHRKTRRSKKGGQRHRAQPAG